MICKKKSKILLLKKLMNSKNNNFNPIVHIATDEKFIDTAYEIYEDTFPRKNLFVILTKNENHEVKYLSKGKEYNFISLDKEYINKIEDLTFEANLIVFHGMNYHQALIALNLNKKNKKYLWTVFGAEVYNNTCIYNKAAVGEMTYNSFVFSLKKWIKDKIRPYYYLFLKGNEEPDEVVKKSLQLMDFAAILYKEELDKFLDLGIIKTEIKHIKFTYYPLDKIISKKSSFVNAPNILLGNSASFSNNHLEAFEVLKKLDLKSQNIITPLSYGNKKYADKIIEIGKRKLGDNLQPLTEFIPLSEYQKILLGCGIVIMNNYRQQAVGNVVNAIYLGAKVYLSNKNTLYHYLKRIGCHVFCIEEDLVPENQIVLDLLSKKQMIENRNKLAVELSLERNVNELKRNLSIILN